MLQGDIHTLTSCVYMYFLETVCGDDQNQLGLVMDDLLYEGFLNLRVQFTWLFVHLRWEKNCSNVCLVWLHREYLLCP